MRKKSDVLVGLLCVIVVIIIVVCAGYSFFGRKDSPPPVQTSAEWDPHVLSLVQYERGQKFYEIKDYENAYIWYYRAKLNGHERAQEQLDTLEGAGWFEFAKLSGEQIASCKKIAEASKNER